MKSLRLILAWLLLWSCAPSAWAQIWVPVPIQQRVSGGPPPAITAPTIALAVAGPFNSAANSSVLTHAITAGNTIFIVITVASPAENVTSCTDSGGNTYAVIQGATAGAGVYTTAIAYSVNITHALTTSSTVSCTIAGAVQWYTGVYYSSNVNSGLDTSGGINQTVAATSYGGSTGTLATANEIIFTPVSILGTCGTITIPSGFTVIDTNTGCGAIAYKIVSATTSINIAWTWTPSQIYSVAYGSFKQ